MSGSSIAAEVMGVLLAASLAVVVALSVAVARLRRKILHQACNDYLHLQVGVANAVKFERKITCR
jgi:hypothetical protein